MEQQPVQPGSARPHPRACHVSQPWMSRQGVLFCKQGTVFSRLQQQGQQQGSRSAWGSGFRGADAGPQRGGALRMHLVLRVSPQLLGSMAGSKGLFQGAVDHKQVAAAGESAPATALQRWRTAPAGAMSGRSRATEGANVHLLCGPILHARPAGSHGPHAFARRACTHACSMLLSCNINEIACGPAQQRLCVVLVCIRASLCHAGAAGASAAAGSSRSSSSSGSSSSNRSGERRPWPFSAYSHERAGANDLLGDFSYEEVHWLPLHACMRCDSAHRC